MSHRPPRGQLRAARGPLIAAAIAAASALALPALAPAATPLPLPKAVDGLPDGRAYERVSPADKNGARIDVTGQAADDGSAVAFSSYGAFAGQPSSPSQLSYVGTRTDAGWRTDPAGIPAAGVPQPITVNGPVRWSTDLRRQIVSSPLALAPGAADFGLTGPYNGFGQNANVYRRDAGGQLTLLSGTEADIPAADRLNFQAYAIGATGDLGKVVFKANAGLAGAPESADAPNGHLFLTTDGKDIETVGMLPGGTPAPQGSYLAGQAAFGGLSSVASTAMTKDLSRIFFMAAPNASDPAQLHVREHAGRPDARTILVSRSERTTPDPLGAVTFRAASTDGSKVLFTSEARLTDDAAPPILPENAQGDLYLYDVDRDELRNLTPNQPLGTRLMEFLGAARDLSVVYFTSQADLAPGATVGLLNLYRWTAEGIRFIGSGGDPSRPGITVGGAAVTPDGDILSFRGYARLTAYDNTDPRSGDPHVMRYVYDARRDTIACASCRPDGKPPTHDVVPTALSTFLPQGPRTMSADGRRIFFETAERLTPGASSTLEKVYMYDREAGTVSMISGGRSEFPDAFSDATPDGSSVFFTTTQRLVGADVDDVPDMYVARVGGGFADPPAPEQPCRADACRSAPAREATPPGAGSTAPGAGNATPAEPARRRTATVKVTRPRTAAGTQTTVRVTVSGAGRISASGSGLRGVSRTSSGRATYSLRLSLTAAAQRKLRARGTLAVKVRVTFTPRSGAARRTTVTVRFRRSTSARRARTSTAFEGLGR